MYLRYLRYVLRHKWFVFKAGLRLGVPLWLLIVHDWSKFLPSEFIPYARFFWGGPRRPWAEVTAYEKTYFFDAAWRLSKEGVKEAFDRAWNHHQKANPHHWQYWLLMLDSGEVRALEMPDRFAREMVADWRGAGLAQGKTQPNELADWYAANRDKMTLHPVTRAYVELLIAEMGR